MRRGIMIVAGLSAILLVAGCTPKFDKIKGKAKGDDKVQVKLTICVRDLSEDVCNDEVEPRQRGASEINHLIAIRVPEGTDVPKKFKTVSTKDGQETIRYSTSRQYGNQLEKKAPTPRGTEWAGYISKPISEAPVRAKYKLIMGLPRNPGNEFLYRPVTGVASNESGETKVNCGKSLFGDGDTGNAGCATDPTKRKRIKKSKKIKLD